MWWRVSCSLCPGSLTREEERRALQVHSHREQHQCTPGKPLVCGLQCSNIRYVEKKKNDTDIHNNYYTMDFWFFLCLHTMVLPQHQLSYKHDYLCTTHWRKVHSAQRRNKKKCRCYYVVVVSLYLFHIEFKSLFLLAVKHGYTNRVWEKKNSLILILPSFV